MSSIKKSFENCKSVVLAVKRLAGDNIQPMVRERTTAEVVMVVVVVVMLAVVGGFLSGWLTRWIAFLLSFPFGLRSFLLREIRGMAWSGHENKTVG